ncbi:MAG: hypothetical protein BWY76_03106 [bacterium ADurb.Bin429]|nr:MAG: hypothetical protein BWY76_03106 [bacterium ADurb.Bin429]
MQVLRGEVRSQVGAVTEDGAELHQSAPLKQMLPFHDILICEERPTTFGHYPLGDRRRLLVYHRGQDTEDGKANKECEDRKLQPAP